MPEGQLSTPEPVGRAWNKAAFRLLLSFARGLGISVGLAFVVWVFYALDARDEARKKATESSQARPSWFKRFGPGAGLKVVSHEVHRRGENLVVLGTMINEGTDSWDRIQLESHFFDAGGRLVALCTGWSSGALRPSKERYFSINCGGSTGMPVPAYSNYRVEIVAAFYEMDDGT